MGLVLVIGGTRSGKSAVAEGLAAANGGPVRYLATGTATDAEMAERIAAHQARRPQAWTTIEVRDPAAEVAAAGEETVLLDGLGAWIARRMHEAGLLTTGHPAKLRGLTERIREDVRALAKTAAERAGETIVVAEEAGLGPTPPGAATRRYLDLAGEATQELAAQADRVLLVVAGRALELPAGDPAAAAKAPAGAVPNGEPYPSGPPSMPVSAGGPSSGGSSSMPVSAGGPSSGGSSSMPVSAGGPSPGGPPSMAVSSEEPTTAGRAAAEPTAGGPAPGVVADELADLGLHGDRMVPDGAEDFAVNVVEDGPPPWLRAALVEALEASDRYPTEDEAVAAIAARHGREPGEVLPLAGAVEAFWLLAAAMAPRRAVCLTPGFTEPELALRQHGHAVERVVRDSERDFVLDPERIPPDADLVVLGNPNNPTGTLDPARRIAALARPGRTLVVDEAFIELVPGGPESLAGATDVPGLVVVRSLTKTFAIPGIRAGYLLGPPSLVTALKARRPPWAVSAPAFAALSACAQRPDAAADIAARVAARRAALVGGLARLPGVRTWPAVANFVLVRVPDGPSVLEHLRRERIAVRPCGTFPGLEDDHMRIAVRRPEATERLLAALKRALA
jgi:histidinol-phosphate/aromatic aminotransferase/cobyric acid decarboxylase-like protein/adenosyl cobinamide kinase/adenosyl cobinamide phosphate guanylyltransferase